MTPRLDGYYNLRGDSPRGLAYPNVSAIETARELQANSELYSHKKFSYLT